MLQVRAAAEEYHTEFAAKETTIITLTAEAEATRAHMQGEIEKLRTEMEVSAAVQIGLGDSISAKILIPHNAQKSQGCIRVHQDRGECLH